MDVISTICNFLITIFLTTFHFGSISDGALWLPPFLALVVPFFFAKNKENYSQAIIRGKASEDSILPIVCWFFAGVFSGILRASGLADGIAGVATQVGVGPLGFGIISFIASAVFATASGTAFGTIATGMGVLYPAGIALGVHPPVLAGAIISGAAFGDNLASISDTTISSATSMGVDVPGVVRSRLKYSLVAGVITIILVGVASYINLENVGAVTSTNYDYDSKTLFMLIPVVVTIWIAIKTGNIITATIVGSVVGSIIAVAFGLLDFIQVDAVDPVRNALFAVSGTGLDREVSGVIFTGLASMLQVIVLALLLFGSIEIMRSGHGDQKLLDSLSGVVKSPVGAEVMISVMIIFLCSLMGLNAPPILAIGPSFARPLADKFNLNPYRVANLMDAQSNTLVFVLPWTPSIIYTLGFARDTVAPLTGVEMIPYIFYPYAILVVMLGSIVVNAKRYKEGKEPL